MTSIVMATRNKASYLKNTLESIFSQTGSYEVIVVDDGSEDNTFEVAKKFPVIYIGLKNNSYRNPALARNVGLKAAKSEIIIQQSDEVVHHGHDTIFNLSNCLEAGTFCIATVYNFDFNNNKCLQLYTGLGYQRPFFFLGSHFRSDLYKIGGYDEEFVAPGYDDDWFGMCLTRGLGLKAVYLPDVVGYHQDHPRPSGLSSLVQPSKELFARKMAQAKRPEDFRSSTGPWSYGVS